MSRTFSQRGFAYETSRPASGYRVQGAGCRVQGAGYRVQGARCRVQGAGCRVQGSGCRVQDVQLAVQLLPLHFAGQRRKPSTLNPKP